MRLLLGMQLVTIWQRQPASSCACAAAAEANRKDEDLKTIARLGARRGSERDPGGCDTNSSDDMQTLGEIAHLADCLRQRERNRFIDIDQRSYLYVRSAPFFELGPLEWVSGPRLAGK